MINLYPESGFSIVAFKDDSCDYKSFYVVAVPFDEVARNAFKEDDILLSNKNDGDGNKVPLAISFELRFPIDFCPHCGKKLAPLIRKKQKKFNILAEKHALDGQVLLD